MGCASSSEVGDNPESGVGDVDVEGSLLDDAPGVSDVSISVLGFGGKTCTTLAQNL